MLVFTRQIGESVVVTGLPGHTRELKVSVVEIRGGRVRLGFEADTDVAIDRSEVRDRKNAVVVPLDPDDAADDRAASPGYRPHPRTVDD